ncbi:MAG: 3-hydroxyacyl-CoA dehydrogenase NAD-binding domain-containing protein [Micropruina sp.]|uniref:3-hydroxyacyl-CoA dehydrogenase/enoyl-CoA hydratase family protein n=1 Tax=Micropruina sp. TaxID=2737536 RepID=UPI0039E54435
MSTTDVRQAVVVGAGAMGSGIAAQLANAGVTVRLLDVVPEGETDDRSRLARDAIARQVKAGGFMLPVFAERVMPGNVVDDVAAYAEADWVIEAVFEDLAVKRDLYATIEAHRGPATMVSSNTSTIPLDRLVEGRDAGFVAHFAITHFFNPPRQMPLLEVVAGVSTDPDVVDRLVAAGDHQLGKTVLRCRDTPGFLANRIGNFWMAVASAEALAGDIDIETADAVMTRAFGTPRTGVFGLFDLVGINLVPSIWTSFLRLLPADDGYHRYDITVNDVFTGLLERGLVGRRGPGGFTRRRKTADGPVDEVIDTETFEYRPRRTPSDPALQVRGLKATCATDSPAGRYAWTVLREFVDYCCVTAPQIADQVGLIDDAMKLGYAWQAGPFELADTVGVDWLVERFEAEGRPVPALLRHAAEAGGFRPRPGAVLATDGGVVELPPGPLTVAQASGVLVSGVLAENASAALVDLGDQVACLTLRTKMNVCEPGVFELIEQALELGEQGAFAALVIGTDHPRAFSAGANLNVFASLADRNDPDELRSFTERGQRSFARLRAASFPVVAAARGLALGGGCELMLAAHHVVAGAELYAGFPERKVGLIPAWGGVTRTLIRATLRGLPDPAARAFALASSSAISGSAFHAQAEGLLLPSDEIVMNGARVLERAKAAALELVGRPRRPEPGVFALHSPRLEPLDASWSDASATDQRIVGALAAMLTGDEPVTEAELLRREIDVALELVVLPPNQDRMRHMLATNRPLEN